MMFQRRSRKNSLIISVVMAATVSLALGACSSPGSGTPVPTSSGSAAEIASFTEKVTADVAAASETQTPETNPVPTDGPVPVTGKKLVIVPCSMAVEGCARPARSIKEAAEVLGWNATIDDPASDGTKISAAIQRAISSKADGLALTAIDAAPYRGDIQAARDAGLKVACISCGNAEDLYQAILPPIEENERAGYLLGEFAYLEAQERFSAPPKFIVLTDEEFDTVKARVAGLKSFISDCQAAGAGCEQVAEGSFLSSEISTVAGGRVVQLVRSNPDYNVLFAGYDAAMLFFAQGLQQAGLVKPNGPFGVAVDADVANTEMIRNDGFQAGSLGFAFSRSGYGLVDDLNRLFSDQDAVPQGMTGKLISKDNVPESGGWDGDFDANPLYLDAWGVN